MGFLIYVRKRKESGNPVSRKLQSWMPTIEAFVVIGGTVTMALFPLARVYQVCMKNLRFEDVVIAWLFVLTTLFVAPLSAFMNGVETVKMGLESINTQRNAYYKEHNVKDKFDDRSLLVDARNAIKTTSAVLFPKMSASASKYAVKPIDLRITVVEELDEELSVSRSAVNRTPKTTTDHSFMFKKRSPTHKQSRVHVSSTGSEKSSNSSDSFPTPIATDASQVPGGAAGIEVLLEDRSSSIQAASGSLTPSSGHITPAA
eukprot:gene30525-37760_t